MLSSGFSTEAEAVEAESANETAARSAAASSAMTFGNCMIHCYRKQPASQRASERMLVGFALSSLECPGGCLSPWPLASR